MLASNRISASSRHAGIHFALQSRVFIPLMGMGFAFLQEKQKNRKKSFRKSTLAKRPRGMDNRASEAPIKIWLGGDSSVPQDISFQQVLDQLRQQDDATASEVYQRFAQRLIALAPTRLDGRLSQRVDAEDVVQSVFKSVFLRLAEGQYVLGDWEGLWALLTAVAVHKCRKWVDYYQAQGRDLNREVAVGSDSSWQVIDREPSPSEAATLKETLEQVLKGLDPREQEIVNLSLQGYQVAEVSGQLGCTESKVYRVLALVRKRLERMREVDS